MPGVDLSDFVAAVEVAQVHALLLARRPKLLDPNSTDHDLYLKIVDGVGSEVLAYAGEPDTTRRTLALWCVCLGTASQLEAALFPEQQDETGRAAFLEGRYAKVLGQLRGRLGDDDPGVEDSSAPAAATGSFPPAFDLPYPLADPWGLHWTDPRL